MSGPFHAGEVAVQRRAGVADEATQVGRMILDHLAGPLCKALSPLRMAVAATLDDTGRPWASLLSGPPGFLACVDPELLLIQGQHAPHDVLPDNLAGRPELGLLAIDLSRRVRVRVNGRALLAADGRLFLSVRQAYSNCPQYITPRAPILDPGTLGELHRSSRLDAEARALVRSADTFFIASHHAAAGADASHRGGPPGFVEVVDDRTIAFPDYPGNAMFNTLGNLAVDPRAGLLFVDFAGGSLLQLTGRATIEWASGRAHLRVAIEDVLSHRLLPAHLKR